MLLHHADTILIIPGTSSVDHLEENMATATLPLSSDQMLRLEAASTGG